MSLQVVIGLCKRKETAALKIKAAVSNGRVKLSAVRRLFSFAVVRQVVPYSMCILQLQSYFGVKSILLICKAVKQKRADPPHTQQVSHYDDYYWDLIVSTIAILLICLIGRLIEIAAEAKQSRTISKSERIGTLQFIPHLSAIKN